MHDKYAYLPRPVLVGREFFDDGAASVWVTANGKVRVLFANNAGGAVVKIIKGTRALKLAGVLNGRSVCNDLSVSKDVNGTKFAVAMAASDGRPYTLVRMWESEIHHLARLLTQAACLLNGGV